MDFVALNITKEEGRYPDFTSFLQDRLDLLHQMIDDHTKGVAEEEDED
jgi:hypothetical protein